MTFLFFASCMHIFSSLTFLGKGGSCHAELEQCRAEPNEYEGKGKKKALCHTRIRHLARFFYVLLSFIPMSGTFEIMHLFYCRPITHSLNSSSDDSLNFANVIPFRSDRKRRPNFNKFCHEKDFKRFILIAPFSVYFSPSFLLTLHSSGGK